MKLPTDYRTGFEKCCEWLERKDDDILFFGSIVLFAVLAIDALTGGILL